MSKAVKTALAIALVLLLAGAMLITFELLRGTSIRELWNNDFGLNVISAGYGDLKGYTVCQTGEESFSPDEVRRIDLSWISGSVKLQPGTGDRIHLKESCEKPLKEEQKLCWKLEKGTLSIRFCSALQTQMNGKDLVLTVPADWTAESLSVGATSAELELRGLRVEGTLEVGATSGGVFCENCVCAELDAGTTSGSVSLNGCECRALTLGATSGTLHAARCRCDSLTASSTSGSIYALCDAKTIELGSTSGSISCDSVPAGCDVTIGTTSGRVRLNLADTSDGQRIEIGTTSGDVYLDAPGAIDLDFDTASGDMSGRLEQGGSGCPTVRVETSSGDLILGVFD